MQRLRSPLFVVLLAGMAWIHGLSQDASTGALRGTVSDSSGARIEAASVALVNSSTGLRYSAQSDAEGRFAIELLPPGDYSARAEFRGLSPQVTPKLHIEINGTTEIAFSLAVAGAKETVMVSDAPQLVETKWCRSSGFRRTPTELSLAAPAERWLMS
jgi:hypothetical protein